MEFIRIKPDIKLLEATAGKGVCDVVFSGKFEICMIAGTINEEVVCYAVFSHIPESDAEVYLEYLYTVPDLREQGKCTELLEHAGEYLAGMGIRIITSRIALELKYALEYNSFIINRGFLLLSHSERIMFYRLDDMLDAETIQTVLDSKNVLPPVSRLSQVDKKIMNVFISEKKHTGFYFFRDECDERYSRFYVEDGKVHGAVIASRPEKDTLYISAIYIDEPARRNNMFLPLLCSCLESVLSEKDINIIICLDDEATYKGMLKIFNPPDSESLVLEHMKYIAKR